MRALRRAAGAVLLLSAAAVSDADASTLHANYSISLIGVPIGVADLTAAFAGGHYSLEVHGRVTGLAALVASTRSAWTGAGDIYPGHISPRTYAVTASNSAITRTIRMAMSGNAVTGIDIQPPFDPKPDLVPVTARDQQGIVDPAGAALLPIPPGAGPTSAAVCERTVPVFDGATRFDLSLTYVGERKVKTKGYDGPVAICSARYTPVSGYRRDRPLTRFWQDNRDIEVWLAPVPGAGVLMLYRISLRTPVGAAVLEADEFRVEEK